MRLFKVWKRFRSNRAIGVRTLKRMQRCTPSILQRVERQRLHFACIGNWLWVGSQSSLCMLILWHAMSFSVLVVEKMLCSIDSLQWSVILGVWLCRRCNIHFKSCQVLSTVCYLIVCWKTSYLYGVAVWLGFQYPFFPSAQVSGGISQVDTRTQPFRNAGASCYINATLQALFGLPSVCELCDDIVNKLSKTHKASLLRADHREMDPANMVYVRQDGPLDGDVLLAITKHACDCAQSSLYPELFLQPGFWQAGVHADAHEHALLKLLDSDVSQARQFQAVLRGEYTWSLKCPHCLVSSCISQEDDRFFTALDIPTHNGQDCMRDVQSCMNHYLKEECVDAHYCWDGCHHCRQSSGRPFKCVTIDVAPPVLCLKLNYFDAHYNILSHFVHPSEEISVHDTSYTVRSVVYHQGNQNAGHYWAIVQHCCENQNSWWLYDDCVRKRVDGPAWKSSNSLPGRVYMVFYAHASSAAQDVDMSGASSSMMANTCETTRSANVYSASASIDVGDVIANRMGDETGQIKRSACVSSSNTDLAVENPVLGVPFLFEDAHVWDETASWEQQAQQNSCATGTSLGDEFLPTPIGEASVLGPHPPSIAEEISKIGEAKNSAGNDILQMLGMVPDESSDKGASEDKSVESLSDNASDDADSDAEDVFHIQDFVVFCNNCF